MLKFLSLRIRWPYIRLSLAFVILLLLTVIFLEYFGALTVESRNDRQSAKKSFAYTTETSDQSENLHKIQSKRILLATKLFGRKSWKMITGTFGYKPYKCSHDYQCQLTNYSSAADALLFSPYDMESAQPVIHSTRTAAQRWIFFSWEPQRIFAPFNEFWRGKFNWTATFMRESDIVVPYCHPYRKLTSLDALLFSLRRLYDPSKKTRFAFAVISNCDAARRWKFVKSLQRYIEVDIYGKCGQQLEKDVRPILDVSRRYRYYLSFENSLCKDYISEKLFDNALRSFAVPVVYGGLSRNDYEHVAPPHSFIYAPDFKNTSSLAEFLISLSKRESDYARYFEWKRSFKIEACGMAHYFVCEICRRLHTDSKPSIININDRFNRKKHCHPEEMEIN